MRQPYSRNASDGTSSDRCAKQERTRWGLIETALPDYGMEIFSEKDDWKKLTDKLEELKIRHEKKIGLLTWFS
jgi:hypothetical protein